MFCKSLVFSCVVFKVFPILIILLCFCHNSNATFLQNNGNVVTTDAATSWLESWKILRFRIKSCVQLTNSTTWQCFKKLTLQILGDLSNAKELKVWPGVKFVRNANALQTKSFDDAYRCQTLQYSTWFDCLASVFAKLITTHTMQLNLKEITDAYAREIEKKVDNKNDDNGSARGRRHRYNMLITMIFGVTALGAILVPMGFQILSIFSGKALLLAKMALLLASINGLKRVANSGVHYGLYQVPSEAYGHLHYDRGDVHHPRNVAGQQILLAQQPLADYGLK